MSASPEQGALEGLDANFHITHELQAPLHLPQKISGPLFVLWDKCHAMINILEAGAQESADAVPHLPSAEHDNSHQASGIYRVQGMKLSPITGELDARNPSFLCLSILKWLV